MSKITTISVNKSFRSSVRSKTDINGQLKSKGSFLYLIAEMQAELCKELNKSKVSEAEKNFAVLKSALQAMISSAGSFEEVKKVIAKFEMEFKKDASTSDFTKKAMNYIQQVKMSIDSIDNDPTFKDDTAKNRYFMNEKNLFLLDSSQIRNIQSRDKEFYKHEKACLEVLTGQAELYSALAQLAGRI